MRIHEARLAVGMTVEEVSELLDIPKRTLYAWEAGTRIPPSYVERMIVEKLLSVKLQNVEVYEDMSNSIKSEEIHEAYMQCKKIFEPSLELQNEIFNIQNKEEKMFYELLANFFMQQRQKELVKKGVF